MSKETRRIPPNDNEELLSRNVRTLEKDKMKKRRKHLDELRSKVMKNRQLLLKNPILTRKAKRNTSFTKTLKDFASKKQSIEERLTYFDGRDVKKQERKEVRPKFLANSISQIGIFKNRSKGDPVHRERQLSDEIDRERVKGNIFKVLRVEDNLKIPVIIKDKSTHVKASGFPKRMKNMVPDISNSSKREIKEEKQSRRESEVDKQKWNNYRNNDLSEFLEEDDIFTPEHANQKLYQIMLARINRQQKETRTPCSEDRMGKEKVNGRRDEFISIRESDEDSLKYSEMSQAEKLLSIGKCEELVDAFSRETFGKCLIPSNEDPVKNTSSALQRLRSKSYRNSLFNNEVCITENEEHSSTSYCVSAGEDESFDSVKQSRYSEEVNQYKRSNPGGKLIHLVNERDKFRDYETKSGKRSQEPHSRIFSKNKSKWQKFFETDNSENYVESSTYTSNTLTSDDQTCKMSKHKIADNFRIGLPIIFKQEPINSSGNYHYIKLKDQSKRENEKRTCYEQSHHFPDSKSNSILVKDSPQQRIVRIVKMKERKKNLSRVNDLKVSQQEKSNYELPSTSSGQEHFVECSSSHFHHSPKQNYPPESKLPTNELIKKKNNSYQYNNLLDYTNYNNSDIQHVDKNPHNQQLNFPTLLLPNMTNSQDIIQLEEPHNRSSVTLQPEIIAPKVIQRQPSELKILNGHEKIHLLENSNSVNRHNYQTRSCSRSTIQPIKFIALENGDEISQKVPIYIHNQSRNPCILSLPSSSSHDPQSNQTTINSIGNCCPVSKYSQQIKHPVQNTIPYFISSMKCNCGTVINVPQMRLMPSIDNKHAKINRTECESNQNSCTDGSFNYLLSDHRPYYIPDNYNEQNIYTLGKTCANNNMPKYVLVSSSSSGQERIILDNTIHSIQQVQPQVDCREHHVTVDPSQHLH